MKIFKAEDFDDLNLRHDLSGSLGPSPREVAIVANKKVEPLVELLIKIEWVLKRALDTVDSDAAIEYTAGEFENLLAEIKLFTK